MSSAGTFSGSVFSLGGVAPIGKLLFRLLGTQTASATSAHPTAATVTMKLYTGTASSAMASFTAGVVSSVLATNSLAMSVAPGFVLEFDTRNEYFGNLATASTVGEVVWVQAVAIVGATNGIIAALDVLGWECGNDPASNYDTSGYTVVETDLY